MEKADNENLQFTKFERADDYFKLLNDLLQANLWVEPSSEEDGNDKWALSKLQLLLDEYQEQAWLLDPYLERMLTPPIESLRNYTHQYVRTEAKKRPRISSRVTQLAMLIYWITKTRGHKTVARFFPHQVQDVSTMVSFARNSDPIMHESTSWPFRYILILWISVIANIPFDLTRFDQDASDLDTASTLENLGKTYLQKSGMESESSALLLSRLYTRNDTSSRLPSFLQWARESLSSRNEFLVIGILRVMGEIFQSSTNQQSLVYRDQMIDFIRSIRDDTDYTGNTVIRKWLSKLTGRAMLVVLPPPRSSTSRKRGEFLKTEGPADSYGNLVDDNLSDVPEAVEEALEYLFTSLEDRDTIVRYAAAKASARIAERLPYDFIDQILDNIFSLFSVHIVEEEGGQLDIPAAAEATWHGACLACAEFARRGLISDRRLPDLLNWMYKALYFDVRRGSHSIGSNVRDAAAYVIWSLARAQTNDSLLPFATELARRLVAVSVYDREIHIRRAASAAFQENVGRQGIFPHGIDVLRKTDFYAVSIRRTAFLKSAPQVAVHLEYRSYFIDHLVNVSLKHWDPAIRSLSAQSLGCLCQLDLGNLGPEMLHRLSPMLKSTELNEIHGSLLSLSELALAFHSAIPPREADRVEVFKLLGRVPPSVLKKYGNELVLGALCDLIATSASEIALSLPEASTWWRPVLDRCIQHRNVAVQEAVARAFASTSQLVLCKDVLTYNCTAVTQLHTSPPSAQQSLARVLGILSYSKLPHGANDAISCLLNCVDVNSSKFSKNVEARRNALDALARIVENSSFGTLQEIGQSKFQEIFGAFINGLNDYTTDERGDVGSWIRIACVRAIGASISRLFVEKQLATLEDWLPQPTYHLAISGTLKQGAERLDNVRQEAGIQIRSVLQRIGGRTGTKGYDAYHLDGEETLWKLFDSEQTEWLNPAFIFPRIVEVLRIPTYRKQVLQGLTLSVGSRNESTLRPASDALVQLSSTLPIVSSNPDDDDDTSLVTLLDDLHFIGRENYASNQSFVPVMLAFELILREASMERISDSEDGSAILKKTLDLACRNLSKFKNIQRITASMKVSIVMLSCPRLRRQAASYVEFFLSHSFPTIRSATAEQLYLALQTYPIVEEEDEEIDRLLLETPWCVKGSKTLLFFC
ncbi:ARM repeat-containing protein [Cantharellus anzutake]|uniref:ARM repeat-containing protein n=1 Tax=Cantharellus anzutake TaxID=1750568 RepID=UPI0019048B99|nr:ARM repeat-containing protein [Cantharellus anzutake]KAF8327012.1 ARM repeat-containing protein [Cantharellus anzutake]